MKWAFFICFISTANAVRPFFYAGNRHAPGLFHAILETPYNQFDLTYYDCDPVCDTIIETFINISLPTTSVTVGRLYVKHITQKLFSIEYAPIVHHSHIKTIFLINGKTTHEESFPGTHNITHNQADPQGIERLTPATGYRQKVVYSRSGSFFRNKYGFLVDINGLLLIADGSDRTLDANSKHHIHIPSRYVDIIFARNGKIWVRESDGRYTYVGTIILVRFENTNGLNIYRHKKTQCISYNVNEFGYMLGTWCKHTWLDGKITTYMSETTASGAGVHGQPSKQGFGSIVMGKTHEINPQLKAQFFRTPGWSKAIHGHGFFQYRYPEKIEEYETGPDNLNIYDNAYN